MTREALQVTGLYAVARDICFEHGMPWTDPRTGIIHQPPSTSPPLRVPPEAVTVVDGTVADDEPPGTVYLAMWQAAGAPYWYVSGQHYHSVTEARQNLAGFNPARVIVVRVTLPPPS